MKKLLAVSASLLFLLCPASAVSQVYWNSFGEALSAARDQGKLIFVYIYAKGDPACERMDSYTFNDPTVRYYLRDKFICTRIDAESGRQHQCLSQVMTEHDIALSLEVSSYPSIVVLAPTGGSHGCFSGYRGPVDLQNMLVFFGEGYYKTTTYSKWIQSQ